MLSISGQNIMTKPTDWLHGFTKQNPKHLKQYINKKYLHWTSSARNAIYLTLKHIQSKKNSNNNNNSNKPNSKLTVAMPAFTCQVVQEAAIRANYNIIYYDSGITTTLKDIKESLKKQLKNKNSKPDALILCYNFGYLPKQLKQIANICKKNNIILIEDCAQALGATQNNILAGHYADYAIYSFGISKNIAFTGGIIATNNKLTNLEKLKKAKFSETLKSIAKSIIAPIILNPLIFPITNKLIKKTNNKAKSYPSLNYSCPYFIKNVIYFQAKRYHKILLNRQNNYKLLTNKNTTDACLYYFLNKKDSKNIQNKAKKHGIELLKMSSFKFLAKNKPNQDNSTQNHLNKSFKKAKETTENHLAFALYRNKKNIKKLKKVLNKINM